MRVPIPEAPEMSVTGGVWAALIAVVLFLGTWGLMLLAPWAALIPNVLLLLAAIWLIGGEMWNKRYDT